MKTGFFRNHRKLTIALSIITFLILLWIFWLGYLYLKLESMKSEIRKSGAPVTIQDLEDSYPKISDYENAATVYQEAFKKYYKPENTDDILIVGYVKMPTFGEQIPREVFEKSLAYYDNNKETMALLNKAVEMEKCRIPLNIERSIDEEYEYLDELRQAVYLFHIQSIIQLDKKNTKGAVDSIESIFKISRSIKGTFLIPYLSKRRTVYQGIEAIGWILNSVQLADDQLKELSSALTQNMTSKENLLSVLNSERCIYINLPPSDLPTASSGGGLKGRYPPNILFQRLMPLYVTIGAFHSGKIVFAQKMDELIEIVDKDFNKKTIDDFRFSRRKAGGQLMSWMAYSYAEVIYKYQDANALEQAALTSLAIERYRLKYSKVPDNLSEVVPEFLESVPKDPFDGKPMRYFKGEIKLEKQICNREEAVEAYRTRTEEYLTKSGYLVYSAGRDGIDNGGTPDRQLGKDSDITFTVVRP